MNRKEFFGGNWKMNHSLTQANDFFRAAQSKDWAQNKEVVFFPPMHILLSLQTSYGEKFSFGAQNCYHEASGAFTGEVSAAMLAEASVSYVILGHSERRSLFAESNELLQKKTVAALNEGLTVIFCVGETLEERESEKLFDVIEKQLKTGLNDLVLKDNQKLVIAYEPVWAIGTGKTASPEQAQEMHAFIREKLSEIGLSGNEIRIIYGGSVKPANAKILMAQPDIDGGLVGGASLKAGDFNQIVNY